MRAIIFMVLLSLLATTALGADGDAIECPSEATGCQMCIEKDGAGTTACFTCVDGYALTFTGPLDGVCTSCPSSKTIPAGSANPGTPASERAASQPDPMTCWTCGPNCATCPQDNSRCSRCAVGRWASAFSESDGTSSCDPVCLVGHTRDVADTDLSGAETDAVCLPCSPGCHSCFGTGADKCTSCAANHYASNFTQSSGSAHLKVPALMTCSACEPGSFRYISDEQITGVEDKAVVCSTCHPSCATCLGSGAGDCTKCATGRYVSGFSMNNEGVLTSLQCQACGLGRTRTTFPDTVTGLEDPAQVCTENCHESCDSCTGPNPTDCIRCAAGYYFSARTGNQKTGSCTICPKGKGKAADITDFSAETAIATDAACTTDCSTSDMCEVCGASDSECVTCPPGTVPFTFIVKLCLKITYSPTENPDPADGSSSTDTPVAGFDTSATNNNITNSTTERPPSTKKNANIWQPLCGLIFAVCYSLF